MKTIMEKVFNFFGKLFGKKKQKPIEVTNTPTPSRTPTSTPPNSPNSPPSTPTPTEQILNTDCICYSVIANTSGGECTTTYYNCQGVLDSITIPVEDNGLEFRICVENKTTVGIVSNNCGFVQVSPTCGCMLTNQSCNEC